MDIGRFYFLKEQYFYDFRDPYLMKNKEFADGVEHGRPCFYGFLDSNTGLFWFIPISSKIEKYRENYNKTIKKYGKSDTIVFGIVLNKERAFLIQNMFPVTEEYISEQYFDSKDRPVEVNGITEKQIIKASIKLLNMVRDGKKVVFPDILRIERELLNRNGGV